MRSRPPCRRLTPPSVADDRNNNPASGPAGRRSQRRTSAPRLGSAVPYIDANWAILRRDVDESPTTSRRATPRHFQPRLRAISGARRVLRSNPWSVASESGTTDLTSTTSTIPVVRWNAKMSIEPRSPQIENDTSTETSQPDARSRITKASTSLAWASSSNRSSTSPFHRSRRSRDAPTARAIERSEATETESIRPRSTFETSAREVQATRPTSSCRRCRFSLSARSPRPNRRSTARI